MTVSFGGLVADHRRQAGLSQEAFASRIGISRNYLSMIECNKTDNLTVATLIKLARAMSVTPGYLLQVQQQGV